MEATELLKNMELYADALKRHGAPESFFDGFIEAIKMMKEELERENELPF